MSRNVPKAPPAYLCSLLYEDGRFVSGPWPEYIRRDDEMDVARTRFTSDMSERAFVEMLIDHHSPTRLPFLTHRDRSLPSVEDRRRIFDVTDGAYWKKRFWDDVKLMSSSIKIVNEAYSTASILDIDGRIFGVLDEKHVLDLVDGSVLDTVAPNRGIAMMISDRVEFRNMMAAWMEGILRRHPPSTPPPPPPSLAPSSPPHALTIEMVPLYRHGEGGARRGPPSPPRPEKRMRYRRVTQGDDVMCELVPSPIPARSEENPDRLVEWRRSTRRLVWMEGSPFERWCDMSRLRRM